MSGGPIFCMGGGGFTMEPGIPALDVHIRSLASARRPRVLFVPTASGDLREWCDRFMEVFGALECTPRILPLFDLAGVEETVASLVLSQDVVYVGGGSLRNLLAVWRAHGVDELLVEAHRRGAVLAGVSAGAMCWFEGGVSCSTGAPAPHEGLGLLAGSLTVHADASPAREEVHRAAVAAGDLPDGWSADDDCGLLFVDGRLQEAVASRPDAGARRVERRPDGTVRELALPVRRLDPAAARETG